VTEVLIDPSGFREYDARWRIESSDPAVPPGLNYRGCQELGQSLAAYLQESDVSEIIVGHDYRRYSQHVKNALVLGLLLGGMDVRDIGLVPSPGAYFGQFHYGVSAVAMVTASHNPNGWTGIKLGRVPGLTFGPDDMAAFRDVVLGSTHSNEGRQVVRGSYKSEPGCLDAYVADLVASWTPRFEGLPRFAVALETGNGTGGLYMPTVLEGLGFEVRHGHTELDWRFPNFNPDPESIPFLRSAGELVLSTGAQVGICLDGDGDRLGVVDERGELLFSDRIGLLIARHMEATSEQPLRFVVDVKSTSLFERELRSEVVWSKTGHSYVKATVRESGAIAGFERSGHFFLSSPYGRGYDDAATAALALLWVLAEAQARDAAATLSSLNDALPVTFQSPNRQPAVADSDKYWVVDRISDALTARDQFAGQEVVNRVTINGIRITLQDGSWLLVRASSNTPNLVIVAESLSTESVLKEIEVDLRAMLAELQLPIGEFESLHQY